MDMDRTDGKEIIHFTELAGGVSLCGVNLMTTPYTFASPDWSSVTCPDCEECRPISETAASPIESVHIEPDRTVENMLAAASHIEKQIQALIATSNARGTSATARDALNLVTLVKDTYATMLG